MKNFNSQPNLYHAAVGEAEVIHNLGVLLGAREQNLSIVKTGQARWKPLADNNPCSLGIETIFFDSQQQDIRLEL